MLRSGEMMADSGCERGVCGPKGHQEMREFLRKIGLKPVKVDKQEEFQFGDGEVVMSDCAFLYPCFLQNKYVGYVRIARVSVPCPPLFSKEMLKEWKCNLRFHDQALDITRFGVTVPFRQGSPVINILDIDRQPVGVDRQFRSE